jgi:hypothetical protein
VISSFRAARSLASVRPERPPPSIAVFTSY